jgi:hypothetical protein
MERVKIRIIKPDGGEFFIDCIDAKITYGEDYIKIKRGCTSMVYAIIPRTYAVIFHSVILLNGD